RNCCSVLFINNSLKLNNWPYATAAKRQVSLLPLPLLAAGYEPRGLSGQGYLPSGLLIIRDPIYWRFDHPAACI
ncbi:hypothetical protein ACT3S8_02630, partial [Halomonas sp. AOP42-D2-25]|uniref:hypothetical protein n=1 Tax=Halomonas sp. AOP42-D2-25 TaxID=3457666 RepID=UPI004034041B